MNGHDGWGLLGRALARRRRSLLRMLGWSAVEALPALTSGLLVAAAADRGFLAGLPWIGLAWLAAYGGCRLIQVFAARRLLPHLADVVEPVRDALADTVVSGTLRRAVHGGERPDTAALARLTTQIRSIRGLVSTLLLEIRRVGMSAVAAVAGLALLAPVVAALAIVPVAVCVVVFIRLQRSLRARQQAILVADERIACETAEVLDGMRDVVACGAEGRVAATVGAAVDAQAAAERRVVVPEAGRLLVLSAAEGLPLLAVLLATPWLLQTQGLTTGQVLGAITYVVSSLQPAFSALLGSVAGLGLQLSVTLERIAVSAVPPDPVSARGAWPQRYTVDVEELTFAYGPHAEPVLRHLTLTVAEGKHLAIVGPSGIGKSTLAHLLTGISRPQQGEVRLGGVPLAEIDERWLRRTVALIPQEAYVFSGTLGDNLRYLAPEATNADLDRAADAIGLRPLVERLGGYGAEIGAAGAVLSAGERQMVALTRVYLSPARIVILDEGTCHLDPRAEARAEQAFRERGGTLIVIAHRISSALRADRILVLDGRDAAYGTHEILLAASPLYRELVGYWTARGTGRVVLT
ncbi:ABC transporter ATP-binding protein [Streptomyces sp. NPDC000851]